MTTTKQLPVPDHANAKAAPLYRDAGPGAVELVGYEVRLTVRPADGWDQADADQYARRTFHVPAGWRTAECERTEAARGGATWRIRYEPRRDPVIVLDDDGAPDAPEGALTPPAFTEMRSSAVFAPVGGPPPDLRPVGGPPPGLRAAGGRPDIHPTRAASPEPVDARTHWKTAEGA